jgi:hypothetical protein
MSSLIPIRPHMALFGPRVLERELHVLAEVFGKPVNHKNVLLLQPVQQPGDFGRYPGSSLSNTMFS